MPEPAPVIQIRVPRDDELVEAAAEAARLAGLMYATDGKQIAIVPTWLPGWRPILRGERTAA